MKKIQKRKKRKGFTLVELIAVIAILAVILTIATISITSIRKNINEKQQLNLQSTVKTAAEGYHNDTGVNIVPVHILLQIGALQADTTDYVDEELGIEKGDPVIIDPLDGKPINCDAVIYDENGTAKYEPDKGCSAEAIEENSLAIQIKIGSGTVKPYDDTKWITLNSVSEKVLFSPILDDKTVDLEYTWTNIYAPDTSFTGSPYDFPIPDSGYVDSEFKIETTYNGVLLYKNFNVKIDAKAPTIENAGIVDADQWAKSKAIIATLVDAESGLEGYQLLKGKDSKCESVTEWKTISGKSQEISETVTKNDYYKICVKDIAGHITSSDDEALKVYKIDNTAPTISVSVADGTTYAKQKVGTITITDAGETDNVVGFNGRTQTFKYGWSTNENAACSSLKNTGTMVIANGQLSGSTTVTISGETGAGYLIACAVDVQDALGNTMDTTKSSKAKMYLDNTGPVCGTATNASTTWINTDRTIKQACSDAHSGCEKSSYDTTYTTTTKTSSVVISDILGNTTTCNYNVYVDKIAPTCGNADNATTSWTNANRTIKQKCSDSDSGCTKTSYDTTYSTTTVTASTVIADVAGNKTTCSYNVYVDKEAPVCGSSSGASTIWTSSNRTISQYCSDATSGCTKNPFATTYNITKQTASTTIYDYAGNSTVCNYNVYVDKTGPSAKISVSSQNSSYNTTSVTVKVSGSDAESGVTQYCYSKTNNSAGCSWSSSGTFTNVSAGSSYNGNSVTFYGWTKDSVGNISSVATTTYKIYNNCSVTTANGNSGYSACSKKCGETGTKSITYYWKDTYLGGACPNTTGSANCSVSPTVSCGNYTWGACSCNGSTGTKQQYRTCYKTSAVDGSSCGSYTDYGSTTSCNSECKSICDYSSDELFGTYSGSISGNTGSQVTANSSWGNWCYAADCTPDPGPAKYGKHRICVSNSCGEYKGQTAVSINSSAGCHFAKYWCQCAWGTY